MMSGRKREWANLLRNIILLGAWRVPNNTTVPGPPRLTETWDEKPASHHLRQEQNQQKLQKDPFFLP